MDGTIADHTGALMCDLAKIQSPGDPPITRHEYDEPDWVKERKRLIRSQPGWWLNLKPIPLGFDIYHLARNIGFQINVLTKGPWTCPHAWTEKVQWCRRELHDDTKITISEDKSIVYGRVLVDDYIPYIIGWLLFRPRGLIVMPANDENVEYLAQAEDYCNRKDSPFNIRMDGMDAFNKAIQENRFFRYTGDQLDEVERAMRWAFDR
jgi:hypothetical protein